MESLGTKLQKLEGLLGTGDLTQWETTFVDSVLVKAGPKYDTTKFTEKQIQTIENIHGKHFA